jgi:hypothetical protein
MWVNHLVQIVKETRMKSHGWSSAQQTHFVTKGSHVSSEVLMAVCVIDGCLPATRHGVTPHKGIPCLIPFLCRSRRTDKPEYGGALPQNELRDTAISHPGSLSLVHIGSMLGVPWNKSRHIGDMENLTVCWVMNTSQSLFWLSYPGSHNVKVCILDVPWTKLTHPTICLQEFCS